MKLVEMKCKNCGSILKINAGEKDAICEYCNTRFSIDDEAQHIKYDDMEKTGYELEKGKIRARREAQLELENEKIKNEKARKEAEKKKKNLKWWILGWIFMFPIPLTILIWKSNIDKKKKIIITCVLWGFLLMVGNTSSNDTITNSNEINNETIQTDEIIYTKNEKINKFINDFNAINPNYAFDSEMIHNELSYKVYIYNDSLKSIEILSKKNNDKNMISVEMYKYGDTTALKEYFNAMLKVFINNIEDNKINELWNQLITNEYEIDYYENNNALKYENIYMSFHDSGNVEINGETHYCLVKIYGEYE